uniref:Flavin-containing monooxygenase n=1 Tax=Gasterosteus aculeatus TaxID=69293 RepID=G3PP33_GASAC
LRVAVVGAGGSGLTSIKACVEDGLEPVCFESSDDIGGLWNFKEAPVPQRSSIYRSLVVNTSKEMMCFSDFPMPADYPNFMHHPRLLEYLRLYAERFQLLRHVRFQVLHPGASNSAESGQWDVVTSRDGEEEGHVFDAVLVCSGHYTHPASPLLHLPGYETFSGRCLHSWDYKDGDAFRGKRVVVVGIGNSGGDIAVEISRSAEQTFLSTRRGSWVMGRMSRGGLPFDMTLITRLNNTLMQLLPESLLNWTVERELNGRYDHRLYGLEPRHRLFSQHPTVNDELPNRILSGTVQVKPDVRRFLGSRVEFDDGSVAEDVDLVVFATGYRFSFPFLASHVVSVSENKAALYKYVFPPELERPTLAVVGLVQPLGAVMPIAEMQARWATRVFKGCIKLPSLASMLQDVRCKQEAMARRYVTSQRHTIQVDYVPYMDELAELVGARPSPLRLLLTDPRLGLNLMLGPCTPYQYRLRGPGKWPGARQAILTQWERVARPMQTRPCEDPKPGRSLMGPLVLAAVCVAAYVNRNKLAAFLQDPTALSDHVKAAGFF